MQNQQPAENNNGSTIDMKKEKELFLRSPKDYDFNKLKASKPLALFMFPIVMEVDSKSSQHFPSQLVQLLSENTNIIFQSILIMSSLSLGGSTFDWALRKKNLILYYTVKPSMKRNFLLFVFPSFLLSQFFYAYKMNNILLSLKNIDMNEIDWDGVKISLKKKSEETE